MKKNKFMTDRLAPLHYYGFSDFVINRHSSVRIFSEFVCVCIHNMKPETVTQRTRLISDLSLFKE